jgi:oligoendopeptidase F
MTAAQATTFGTSLRPDTLHPYMWAVKRHYYTSHFYNWQYTFGLLFGLGLFSRYLGDPDGFRAEYDDMLSRAGMDTAGELAARFGIDLADPEFWTSSLDIIRDRIDQYEALT